jgi:hypothetical protein
MSSLHNDTQAPRLVAAKPVDEKRLDAQYTDDKGVSYVEMYVDDEFVTRDYEAPFVFDIDAYTNRQVSLVAYDSAANSTRMDLE